MGPVIFPMMAASGLDWHIKRMASKTTFLRPSSILIGWSLLCSVTVPIAYSQTRGSVNSSPKSTFAPIASASTVMQNGTPILSNSLFLYGNSASFAIVSASTCAFGQKDEQAPIISDVIMFIIPPGQIHGTRSPLFPKRASANKQERSVDFDTKPLHSTTTHRFIVNAYSKSIQLYTLYLYQDNIIFHDRPIVFYNWTIVYHSFFLYIQSYHKYPDIMWLFFVSFSILHAHLIVLYMPRWTVFFFFFYHFW